MDEAERVEIAGAEFSVKQKPQRIMKLAKLSSRERSHIPPKKLAF